MKKQFKKIICLILILFLCGCISQDAGVKNKLFSKDGFSFNYPSIWKLNDNEIDDNIFPTVSVSNCYDKECLEGDSIMIMWLDHEVDLLESINVSTEGEQFGYSDNNAKNIKMGEFTKSNFKGNNAYTQMRSATFAYEHKDVKSYGKTILFNCNGNHYMIFIDKHSNQDKELEEYEVIKTFKC